MHTKNQNYKIKINICILIYVYILKSKSYFTIEVKPMDECNLKNLWIPSFSAF